VTRHLIEFYKAVAYAAEIKANDGIPELEPHEAIEQAGAAFSSWHTMDTEKERIKRREARPELDY
jgi:hypothetical protein